MQTVKDLTIDEFKALVGEVVEEKLRELLTESYRLVWERLSKKRRGALTSAPAAKSKTTATRKKAPPAASAKTKKTKKSVKGRLK